ncbi:MAG: glycoside hydrolase family 3 protein, partial [Candidatus Aminicenantes bacterium]
TTDLESAIFVAKLTESFQNIALQNHPRIPLLIAIDQEGGGHMQLIKGVTRIPFAIQLGATRSATLVYKAGEIVGSELKCLGINTVLAPVADVNNNNENDIIGRRAFGAHPDIVTPMSVAFMKGLQSGNVLSVAKHFPGHGSSQDDPHFVLPKLGYKDRSQLDQKDLFPFKELIKKGVNGIMTSHILAEVIDRGNAVTVSKIAINKTLRDELGFKRLIFTDDLSKMIGILKDPHDPRGPNVYKRSDIALKSYLAGNDILIFGQITQDEDERDPERTVTEEEFDDIYLTIRNYFESTSRQPMLKEKVKRIIRAKIQICGSLSNLRDLEAWSERLDESDYGNLLSQNKIEAEKMARASVVLISERGNIINKIGDSNYFGPNKGPLKRDEILQGANDKLTIVSPVFMEDELTEGILEEWIPGNRIKTVHMVYGWRSESALIRASEIWNQQVRILSYRDPTTGAICYNEDAINEKAQEIENAAQDSRIILFGILTHGQIKVLERVCNIFRNNREKMIIVLVLREPYFVPGGLYLQKNTIFIYVPALPTMAIAKDVLFGRINPNPVSFLPVSIPGPPHSAHNLVDRAAVLGQPVAPLERHRKPLWIFPKGNIWFSLLGGLLGALVFFSLPRGNLVWKQNSNNQWNFFDLIISSSIGIAIGIITSYLLPLLNKGSIFGLEFGDLSKLPSIIVAAVFTIIFQFIWLSRTHVNNKRRGR